MSVFITKEDEFNEDIPLQEISERLLSDVCRRFEVPYETDVEVLLTDENEMRVINKAARRIDRPTDVLSFPFIDFEKPGELPDERFLDFDPDTKHLPLGQIVVCTSVCESQAESYGHSLTREYAFLIAHSLLHLLGMDHEEPAEEKEMFLLQETILNDLGYTR